MSPDSKRIKIFTLISLVFGVLSVIAGVVLASTGTDAPYASGSGALSLICGVRGSLLANVPNKADKIVKLSGIFLLIQVIFAAVIVYLVGISALQDHVITLVLLAVSVVVTLCVLVSAQILNRKNLAK
ncbi:MAG: hypothetical protein ACOX4F_05410 [Atopobiaceae bacterium]